MRARRRTAWVLKSREMLPALSRRHSTRVGLLGRDMPIIVVSTTNRWNLYAMREGGRTVRGVDGVQGW